MPSTIPFDPSLVLGNIANPAKIKDLMAIAEIQKPVDAAQRELNELILAKHKLDMTLQEMINMNVDQEHLDDLVTQIKSISGEMATQATLMAAETIRAQKALKQKREHLAQTQISESVESPMDYNKSEIKKMPLSSDSMSLDTQYFRCESNDEGSKSHSSAVATYVSTRVSSFLSPTYGAQVGASTKKAMESQHQAHNVQGTLVVSANCTHKISDVFAPFVLDPEKAIRAWNVYNKSDSINTSDKKSMKSAVQGKGDDDAKMHILSGATYGSSFVGLVHILQDEKNESSQSASSVAAAMRSPIEENLFLSDFTGKFGVDASFANTVKSLMSTSNIQSHASVITVGLIPSIVSNKLETSVQSLKPDPTDIMGQLAAIQGANDTQIKTMGSRAANAKAGESFMQLNNEYVKNVVSSISATDHQSNEVIDTNSMMTALDDYIKKAGDGKCGAPINFFLKPITKQQLAEAWLNKFYPGDFIGESSGDDNATGPAKPNPSENETGSS